MLHIEVCFMALILTSLQAPLQGLAHSLFSCLFEFKCPHPMSAVRVNNNLNKDTEAPQFFLGLAVRRRGPVYSGNRIGTLLRVKTMLLKDVLSKLMNGVWVYF